nr:tRNA (guanosine(46)-N7)-methyltransferase TrmB [Corynebacterium lactis]
MTNSDIPKNSSAESPAENSAATPSAKGDLPHGRPEKTQFNDGLDYPRIGNLSFRRGTLTANQEKIWEDNWDTFGKVLSDEAIDVEGWFGRKGPTIVEIGCGTGTSTVAMAPQEPDHNIIAVELYKPGLAKLLSATVRGGVPNIRMVRGDGVEVLQRMIEPESLDGVRLFFPDPWPKARHHKRRILQSGTLRLISSRLKPGGIFHAATDHAGYAEWIEELRDVEPTLEPIAWPWPESPMLLDRPTTKFEARGLRMDHSIHEFIWRKREA